MEALRSRAGTSWVPAGVASLTTAKFLGSQGMGDPPITSLSLDHPAMPCFMATASKHIIDQSAAT